jgi:hypothetical protein
VIEAMADVDYRSTGLGHVVSAAGISRKTLYEYYRHLDEAFLEVYRPPRRRGDRRRQTVSIAEGSAGRRACPTRSATASALFSPLCKRTRKPRRSAWWARPVPARSGSAPRCRVAELQLLRRLGSGTPKKRGD